MATTEHTINDTIATLLRETRRAWRDSSIVRSENIGMLEGSGARSDILVQEPNVSPVVIETEVQPAASVETEARATTQYRWHNPVCDCPSIKNGKKPSDDSLSA